MVSKRKVLKASRTWSKTLSLIQAKVSLRNARNNVVSTSNTVTIKIRIKIGRELSLNDVVPKKSLSLYILLSINLQFWGFVFWPMMENSIKYSKEPNIRLSPLGNAAYTKPISPIVCIDSMKYMMYCDLRKVPAIIAKKMMIIPSGLAREYAGAPQKPPIRGSMFWSFPSQVTPVWTTRLESEQVKHCVYAGPLQVAQE